MTLMVNQLNGFGTVTPPKSFAFTDSSVNAASLTTYTFATQDLGTPAPDRYVVVGVDYLFSGSRTVSTLTINGVSATRIVGPSSATNVSIEMWGAFVPSGATGDVVVTLSGASLGCGIGVWALSGLYSATPVDTGTTNSNPGTDTLNTSSNGYLIAMDTSAAALGTRTWTNLTEQFDETVDAPSSVSHSGAAALTDSGTVAVTSTRSAGAQHCMVLASFA
jgi:hypothetical protein